MLYIYIYSYFKLRILSDITNKMRFPNIITFTIQKHFRHAIVTFQVTSTDQALTQFYISRKVLFCSGWLSIERNY